MQIRKEYKYLVRRDRLDELREQLMPFMELDSYVKKDKGFDYKVRSVYFDTGKMNYFVEKDSGIQIRKKFRIRGYDDTENDSLVFLEVKRKNNEIISKNRSPVKYKNLHNLFLSRDIDKHVIEHPKFPRARDDANIFLYYLYSQYLIPVVLIVYDREPYFSKFNSDLRITLDKNIRSKVCPHMDGIFSEPKEIYALNDYFVLEIKFNFGYPGWLNQIIREFGLVRQSVSKYNTCIMNHQKEIETMFRHPSIEFFNSSLYSSRFLNEVLA